MKLNVHILLCLIFIGCDQPAKEKIFVEQEEPLFALLDNSSIEYKRTVHKSSATLPIFIDEVKKGSPEVKSVKVDIPLKEEGAFLWLVMPRFYANNDSCEAKIFEVPPGFAGYEVGMKLKFHTKRIHDWFIISEEGEMSGGFSLRLMRSKLPTNRHEEFDEFIGVKSYAS